MNEEATYSRRQPNCTISVSNQIVHVYHLLLLESVFEPPYAQQRVSQQFKEHVTDPIFVTYVTRILMFG